MKDEIYDRQNDRTVCLLGPTDEYEHESLVWKVKVMDSVSYFLELGWSETWNRESEQTETES
jgi:hypothetical protein